MTKGTTEEHGRRATVFGWRKFSEYLRAHRKNTSLVYKWINRYDPDNPDWDQRQSRQPHACRHRTPKEIEEVVELVRLNLYNKALLLRRLSHPLGNGRFGCQADSFAPTLNRILTVAN
jgi:hypothetical protein